MVAKFGDHPVFFIHLDMTKLVVVGQGASDWTVERFSSEIFPACQDCDPACSLAE